MNYMNNKVSIVFIQQLILVSRKLHLKCWYGGWDPFIRGAKEPVRRGPAWAVKYGRFSKTGDPCLPGVRRGTLEAQLSPDGEVAWLAGAFISDSMWEKPLD